MSLMRSAGSTQIFTLDRLALAVGVDRADVLQSLADEVDRPAVVHHFAGRDCQLSGISSAARHLLPRPVFDLGLEPRDRRCYAWTGHVDADPFAS
jgi:hypothetical protein